MRLFGIMELQLASSFLPLLLLVCLLTGTVIQTEESVTPEQCKFEICSKNLTVWVVHKPQSLKGNQTNTTALGENCMNITCMRADYVANCELMISIKIYLTDTGNDTQETAPRCCPEGPQANVTEEKIWTGLNLLCFFFGLSAGTFIYTPIIGLLLWQCRRNRTGKLTRREVAEGNQLTMAAPVTGTEDLTYANLNFEKKGTKSATSNTIYTEIKPSQQQQSGGAAIAANTEVDVCPRAEGK